MKRLAFSLLPSLSPSPESHPPSLPPLYARLQRVEEDYDKTGKKIETAGSSAYLLGFVKFKVYGSFFCPP
jgi:hypothetical protein